MPGRKWGFPFLVGEAMHKLTTEELDEIGEATRAVFEKRADRRLSGEDLRAIGENLVGFFRTLGEWSRDLRARGIDSESPKEGDNEPSPAG